MDANIISKFIRGVFVIGFGSFIQKSAGFITFIVVLRHVTKEELGCFVLMLLVCTLFQAMNGLLLQDMAVAKMVSSAGEVKKNDIALVAICYKSIFTILTCPIILFLIPSISTLLDIYDINNLNKYIILIFISINLEGIFLSVLQGYHEYKKMAFIQSTNGLLRVGFVCFLVVFLNYGIYGFVWSYLLSYLFCFIITFLILPFKIYLNLNMRLFVEIFKFGFPLGLNGMLTLVFTRIDRLMIGSMIGSSGVAVYETASKIPHNTREAYNSFHKVFFPNMAEIFSKKKYKEASEVLNNSLRLVTFFCAYIFLIVTLFKEDIVTLLFTEKYIESASLLPILALALCVALPSNLIGTTLVAFGLSDKPVKINIVETLSNIFGNYILIPIYGLHGAAIATLISRCMSNPVNVWFLRKAGVKVDIFQYLKPILACLAMIVLFEFLGSTSVIYKMLFVLLFPGICVLFSIVKGNDLAQLFGAFKYSSSHAGV